MGPVVAAVAVVVAVIVADTMVIAKKRNGKSRDMINACRILLPNIICGEEFFYASKRI